MNKHFEFYNKSDETVYNAIPSIIKTISPVDIPKKKEMYEFFKDRKFILEFLSPHQALIFTMCYGLYDGNFMNYKQIGEALNISPSQASQISLLTLDAIRNRKNLDQFALLTDKDVDYDENIIWNRCRIIKKFGFYNIDDTKIAKLENKKDKQPIKTKIDSAYYNKFSPTKSVSNRHKSTKLILHKILSKKYNISDEFKLLQLKACVKNWWNIKNCTYEDILSIPVEKLQNVGLQNLIDEMHQVGLHFTSEAKYQEDWQNLCLSGLLNLGGNGIKNTFHLTLNQEKEEEINQLLSSRIATLGLNSNDLYVLNTSGIRTIKDLTSYTQQELTDIKILDTKPLDINDIIDKLHARKLNLRPEKTFKNDWIDSILAKNCVEEIPVKTTEKTI